MNDYAVDADAEESVRDHYGPPCSVIAGGLKIPQGEAMRCETYRNPRTSEVSYVSYSLAESLSRRPYVGATIRHNGTVLARSVSGDHWSLLPAGQLRLGWEASLLKERWRV